MNFVDSLSEKIKVEKIFLLVQHLLSYALKGIIALRRISVYNIKMQAVNWVK